MQQRSLGDQLLLAIMAAPVQVAVFDSNMDYVAASDLWVERQGLASASFAGRPRYELSEARYQDWRLDFAAALAGSIPSPRRQYRLCPDGQQRWERSKVRCWQSAIGDGRGVVVTIEDITTEVEAETALTAALRSSELLQDMSHSGLWHCNLKDNAIHWSDETRRILGQGPQAAIDYDVYLSLIHSADRERVAAHWQTAIDPSNPETSFEIEHRIVVSGETSWVRKVFLVDRELDGTARRVTGVLQDISLNKRRNAALRLSTSRLRGLFDYVGLGVFLIDKDGRFIEANDQFKRITGHQVAELIGRRRWADLLSPVLDSEAVMSLERLSSGRDVTVAAEGPFDRPDGARIWIRLSAFAIRDQNGNLIEIAATVEDVTDRKTQEAALIENEERFRGFFNSLPVGAARLDPDWMFRDVNDAFCRLVGYDRSELLGGMNALDLSPAEDRAGEEARRASYFASGAHKKKYFKRFQSKQGKVIEVRIAATVTFDKDGRPLSIVAIMENVSEIERMQNALLDSERKLRLAIEAASLGVWEFDPRTGEASWNRRLCEMLGYDADAVTPGYLAWKEKVLPEDQTAAEAIFNSSFRHGLAYSNQFRVRGSGQEVRWLEAHGRSILDRDGRPTHSYGVVFDQTERKKKEALNAVLLGELNHRAKNLLSVVQSIAFQTAWDTGVPEFYPAFSGRLFGLSASHDLLVQTGWAGVELKDLAVSQLAHLKGMIPERIDISGPQLTLRPAAAQAIGMAIHELSTNAVKYGALSDTQGKVALHWRIYSEFEPSTERIEISWIETGGPRVQPPREKGFGQSVLVTTCEHLFETNVQLTYRESGLSWRIDAELDKLRAKSMAGGAAGNDNRQPELRGQA